MPSGPDGCRGLPPPVTRNPSWFCVFLAVEGLALRACTVIAAQRYQTSKLPISVRQHAPNLRNLRFPFWQSCVR